MAAKVMGMYGNSKIKMENCYAGRFILTVTHLFNFMECKLFLTLKVQYKSDSYVMNKLLTISIKRNPFNPALCIFSSSSPDTRTCPGVFRGKKS